MTLETLFLMIVTIYLVLIAYGIVGLRRRGLAGRPKLISQILIVLTPPALIAALLAVSGESALVVRWRVFLAAMAVTGAIVAVLTDRIAARVEP